MQATPQVRKIEATTFHQPKRRIGVYVRVSSDSSDQQNSYASQISYYTALIEKHPEWELVDVYADEGITGTKLDKRDEFLRLMGDARKGKLDEILVKSISRFARNTKDCLSTLRELSLLGVTVRFDKENINTGTLTSELMVSVSASLAQEESISLSQNMRWSYQKRMQSGKFITHNAPFGYRLHGKEMTIDEDEAEIVRWVFDSYLDGMNMSELAEAVTATGFRTSDGNPLWRKGAIGYMLQNEKYIGDSMGQKAYMTEAFPFKEVDNRGEKPMYYAEGTHPAIIDKDTFNRVQALIQSRRPKNKGKRGEYLLSRKIICAQCGSTFARRVTQKGNVFWVCRIHESGKDVCSMGRIPEQELYAAFMRTAMKLKMNLTTILAPAIAQLQDLSQSEARSNGAMLAIAKEIAALQEKTLVLNRLRERNLIPADAFLTKNAGISTRLAELKRQRRILLEGSDESHNVLTGLRELQRILKETKITPSFDEELFASTVETVIAESADKVWFRMLGGLKLPAEIRRKSR